MEKTGYKNTYYRVITKANLEEIKRILNECGYYDETAVEQIAYEETNSLPYFILHADSPEYIGWGRFAMLDGIFVKIHSIIPEWEDMFYLPVVIVREMTNEKLKPLINPDMLKDHELHHLRHIISHIDQYPDYIERSRKYNAGSASFADIRKSIAFEVGKLFSIELPALTSDYEKGERNYYLYDEGRVSIVSSRGRDEFIQYNLAQYIAKLRMAYIDRFSEKQAEISELLAKEVNKQGEKIFGKNTMSVLAVALFKVMFLAQKKGKSYEIEAHEL